MPEQDDEERPVEGERGQPQPLLLAVDQPGGRLPRGRRARHGRGDHRRLGVAEERPEQQDLERHADDDAGARPRGLDPARPDPRQRPLLAARRRDPERHRGARPADHLGGHADDEHGHPEARQHDAQHRAQGLGVSARPRGGGQDEHGRERENRVHRESPRHAGRAPPPAAARAAARVRARSITQSRRRAARAPIA